MHARVPTPPPRPALSRSVHVITQVSLTYRKSLFVLKSRDHEKSVTIIFKIKKFIKTKLIYVLFNNMRLLRAWFASLNEPFTI